MSKVTILYHQLAKAILETGYEYTTDNRPDIPCKQISSVNLEIPLNEFPLLTTKKMFTKGIVAELLWFLKGDSHVSTLNQQGVTIWNKDTYSFYLKCYEKWPLGKEKLSFEQWEEKQKTSKPTHSGDAGRHYGQQWRNWQGGPEIFTINIEALPLQLDQETTKRLMKEMHNTPFIPFDDTQNVTPIMRKVDQIEVLLDGLRKPNPLNRRHIVTAWNPAELSETALPPCHWAFEILPRPLTDSMRIDHSGGDKEYLETLWKEAVVRNDEEAKITLEKELAHVPKWGFTLKWHQRSVDTFLGLPFNIASYALLALIIGSITDMVPLNIIGDLSNVHFYTKPENSESESHIELVKQQLMNNPAAFPGPGFEFSTNYMGWLALYKKGEISFDDFLDQLSIDDFMFKNYQSFPPLKGDMYEPTA